MPGSRVCQLQVHHRAFLLRLGGTTVSLQAGLQNRSVCYEMMRSLGRVGSSSLRSPYILITS